METWKDIPGYEGKYQASSFGRIRSLKTINSKKSNYGTIISFHGVPKILKFDKKINGAGYYNCSLTRHKSVDVHRLIALTFLGAPPTDQHQVNHKNLNKLDNNIENLEWLLPKENIEHYMKHKHNHVK